MTKKISILIWMLVLVLSNTLLFLLEQGMTATFWIAAIFLWVAFISTLIFQIYVWRKIISPEDSILYLPSITISIIYESLQIPLCIIFSIWSNVIPYKVTILVHVIALILAWILILASITGNDHVQNVNGRQKDHHIKL